MNGHNFVEWKTFKFEHVEKTRSPQHMDLWFMSTREISTSQYWLRDKKRPLFRNSSEPVCVICSMVRDHPHHKER